MFLPRQTVDFLLSHFGSNMHFINDVKSFLFRNFDMKDLGHVDVILGIKLIKKDDDMVLIQHIMLKSY